MGLDMYLERMPRYKNTTPHEINVLESYFRWKTERLEPDSKKCSFKKWTGIDYAEVPKGNTRKFYEPFCTTKYYHWDFEKRWPTMAIIEQVGYWRKANQIHNWFVNNVQDGVDDCSYHDEITKETLEELLNVCQKVLNSCELVSGKVANGYTFNADGTRHPIMEDGQYVKDPSVAKELLPSHEGFFFGGYNYDQYYVEDIKATIDIITKVLETTDFKTQMIYYSSSW